MTDVRRKSRRLAVENSKWQVFLDHVEDGRGNEVRDYLVVQSRTAPMDHMAGVAILAQSEGRIVLLHSYRHALGTKVWDLLRGFIDAGETSAPAALRALAEG